MPLGGFKVTRIGYFVYRFCKFRSFKNNKDLSIFIEYFSKHEKLFASFNAKKKKLTTGRLLLNFLTYPFMTIKVILGIHLEALFLYLKGIKIYKCPDMSSKIVSNYIRKEKWVFLIEYPT